MAVDTQDSARDSTTTTRFWNDPRIRSIIYQILVVLVVILTGWFLYSNLVANLAQRGISTGYGFLTEESGFAISEHFISYSAADTYGRAFIVGILNTLRVAALGIVLATIIGTIVGVARLSSNWLIAKLATVYVEGMRNIPVLLWLFIWYAVITVSLPHPRVAIMPIEGIVLSNRGLMFAVPADHPIHLWMWIAFFVGLAITWFIRRWAARRQAATGQQFPAFRAGLAAIIGLPLIVWLIGGAPTDMDVPTLQGFNFAGGVTFSPEFAAVLFGLTFYTASFIAEIVRSGIQAVSYGQTEAASALGLRPTRVLRLVVLPQALRIIIPPTTSQYLNLTKNSSLAVAVGYPDLVSVGNTTLNQTGQAIEAISIYMLVYLTISLSISLGMNIYDKRIALVER
ncbi:amino acid ABC transporter permease [Inquilinus sp. CAU 1745]|uniref:amino acid ABC transporter permease n=1 Tax=Inquilinus sp. CAU 1745 TaxID=3140369 RepID=UPI00325B8E25